MKMPATRELDELLIEAQREVDAMLPHTPPIAPQPSATYRRDEWLRALGVPEARAAEVVKFVRLPSKRSVAFDRLVALGFLIDLQAREWICPDGARVSFNDFYYHGEEILMRHRR